MPRFYFDFSIGSAFSHDEVGYEVDNLHAAGMEVMRSSPRRVGGLAFRTFAGREATSNCHAHLSSRCGPISALGEELRELRPEVC